MEQIWVYGTSFETSLVAMVVPHVDPLKTWAVRQGISLPYEELCSNSLACEHVLRSLQATGRQQGLVGYELLRGIRLLPEGFTVDNGL